MSTRAVAGFRLEGKDYLSYVHSDGYPTYLGKIVYEQAFKLFSAGALPSTRSVVKDLILINDHQATPSIETLQRIKKANDKYNLHLENVSSATIEDTWYDILRELQGELIDSLFLGYALNSNNFIYQSLFCEWGYIINLDNNTFEVYRGFNQDPAAPGRYSDNSKVATGDDDYVGCKLISTVRWEYLTCHPDCTVYMENLERFASNEDLLAEDGEAEEWDLIEE